MDPMGIAPQWIPYVEVVPKCVCPKKKTRRWLMMAMIGGGHRVAIGHM